MHVLVALELSKLLTEFALGFTMYLKIEYLHSVIHSNLVSIKLQMSFVLSGGIEHGMKA